MRIGLLGAVFLILFTLKVAGVAQISWWVVVLPLLASLIALVVVVLLLAGAWFLGFIMELFSKNK